MTSVLFDALANAILSPFALVFMFTALVGIGIGVLVGALPLSAFAKVFSSFAFTLIMAYILRAVGGPIEAVLAPVKAEIVSGPFLNPLALLGYIMVPFVILMFVMGFLSALWDLMGSHDNEEPAVAKVEIRTRPEAKDQPKSVDRFAEAAKRHSHRPEVQAMVQRIHAVLATLADEGIKDDRMERWLRRLHTNTAPVLETLPKSVALTPNVAQALERAATNTERLRDRILAKYVEEADVRAKVLMDREVENAVKRL